jgi:hypothetical protein
VIADLAGALGALSLPQYAPVFLCRFLGAPGTTLGESLTERSALIRAPRQSAASVIRVLVRMSRPLAAARDDNG